MAKTLKKYDKITEPINEISNEVNMVLNNREKEKYFEKIVLTYSLIENLLKWLVYIQLSWSKCKVERDISELDEEWDKLQSFCKNINFYGALNISLSIDLISLRLYKEIDEIRNDRNNLIHQFWIYSHRKNFRAMRKKLEKLARIANELIETMNKLADEIGLEDVYTLFL